MPKILEKYNFNVATSKTKWVYELDSGQKGGRCPKDCTGCIAYKKQCDGCDLLCPDRECKGQDCERCPFLCSRGGERLTQALKHVSGLCVDTKRTIDNRYTSDIKFIPAYNKRLPDGFTFSHVSIPFYAVYDFESGKPLCSDVKDFLNIPDNTSVNINFYFKDDKIMHLFDAMMNGTFISLLRSYSGVETWHTPCFSVFKISSGMDCLLNFKRQFWIGDIMRDSGMDVFQEVLYSTLKKRIHSSPNDALEIIQKKGIKKISQCGQLNFDQVGTLKREMSFIRNLPSHIAWFITGLSQKGMDAYNSLRPNMLFSNYSSQFRFKGNFEEYINTVNESLRRR